jgi:hypothetical protein
MPAWLAAAAAAATCSSSAVADKQTRTSPGWQSLRTRPTMASRASTGSRGSRPGTADGASRSAPSVPAGSGGRLPWLTLRPRPMPAVWARHHPCAAALPPARSEAGQSRPFPPKLCPPVAPVATPLGEQAAVTFTFQIVRPASELWARAAAVRSVFDHAGFRSLVALPVSCQSGQASHDRHRRRCALCQTLRASASRRSAAQASRS